jgi:hypothetical protein
MGTAMTRRQTEPLRRSIVPAVFIAWIWLGTLHILGYEPPLLIGLPVGMLLFGVLLWGQPLEMYWPPSALSQSLMNALLCSRSGRQVSAAGSPACISI